MDTRLEIPFGHKFDCNMNKYCFTFQSRKQKREPKMSLKNSSILNSSRGFESTKETKYFPEIKMKTKKKRRKRKKKEEKEI